jgi:GNAT superfamily N-acetyltransferase
MKRPTTEPTFRKMTGADLARVTRLVKEYHAFDKLPFDAAHTRAALRTLLRHPQRGSVFLILAGARTAGYLVLTPCFSLEFHHEVFLDELFLRKGYRGRGLGQAALAFAADWARRHGVTAIHVISEQANPAARRAYRKAGFGGAHRFLMTRLVDPPKHLR